MSACPSIDDAVAALYPLDIHPSYLSCTSPAEHQPASRSCSPLLPSYASLCACPPPSQPPGQDDTSLPDESSSDSGDSGDSGDSFSSKRKMWSPDEHARFLEALRRHVALKHRSGLPDAATGKLRVGLGRGAARKIAQAVGTRSEAQVRSHAQKVFQQASRAGRSPWEV
ncbi:hypothetical protein GUITHDRAFT_105609 [Guillardia theta CCMP2712]|uniref:Uncharacterized protein n=1 Tax=Guillardia theta (strain CCMP2712) TaxID=905079 RepID=L1JIW6_GUITC|nr:hypothetical protein GUITHDRAFT_105608 [Guillardia theta CCMP2712]XP_005835444.1 hypothetical protein GUITHDRAFT_105609 [Guillardia theta CCMP2712]EKX48463.1 hypothetical protein GUITHDRAFT_105608 [Guillardia theta CCMP2712]EKX48464.1 hypothetical protein GUITHDRAFT_105609 [Guillardia theta CCMP2712]|mmetsp:Transcript_1943/g.5841  ORF Transcript_1943/g.5841 Transcript_1943/m.5841 type:complete len:169 (-) Transcript_1943:1110-1616(-)|eukprot:XP_005835443.1 hypothetical protein GUITHDRAFT_105608 [Guillardia theta CCMP2712]